MLDYEIAIEAFTKTRDRPALSHALSAIGVTAADISWHHSRPGKFRTCVVSGPYRDPALKTKSTAEIWQALSERIGRLQRNADEMRGGDTDLEEEIEALIAELQARTV